MSMRLSTGLRAIVGQAGLLALAACTDPVSTAPPAADASVGGDAVVADTAALEVDSDAGDAADATPVHAFVGEAWADNWFRLYRNGEFVAEDSVPITTEKSFNKESVAFSSAYPFTLAFVLKDFKQDDSGLEYIGKPNQQIGDGGFIFQLREASSGKTVAVSDAAWRCLVIHKAPLNPGCVKDPQPLQTCGFQSDPEPEGWRNPAFDDSAWPHAVVHTAADVGPKDGYFQVTWAPEAKFVWSADLKLDNTVLCRVTVSSP